MSKETKVLLNDHAKTTEGDRTMTEANKRLTNTIESSTLLDEAILLLKDADICLEEFGACDYENCNDPNCLKIRHRISKFITSNAPAERRVFP